MKKLNLTLRPLRSVLHASCSLALGMICLGLATSASAGPIVVFSSNFDNNTGQTVIAGDADDTSGSSQVNDISWTEAPGIIVNSNLNLLPLTGGGGFTQVQNGLNPLSNQNVVFINDSLVREPDEFRGYSVDFLLSDGFSYIPDKLNIEAQLSNAAADNGGGEARVNYQLLLGSDVLASGSVFRPFTSGTDYDTFSFNVSGVTLTSGNNYTVRARINALTGSVPAYASFNGLEMQAVPEPGTALLLGLGFAGLGVVSRSRRGDRRPTA